MSPDGSMTWGEAGQKALKNLGPDLGNSAVGLLQQVGNPVGTGLEFGKELATSPEARQALKEHYTNYLSTEGLKKNIAENPVGTALDVATLVTPLKGAGLAAKGEELAAELPATKIAVGERMSPATATLKSNAGATINAAKKSGVYFDTQFVKPLRDTITTIADEMNFRPGRPGTEELNNILKDVDSMSHRPWSFNDIHTLQMDLNDAWKVARNQGRDQVAGIAGRLRGVVSQFLDNVANSNGEGLIATGDITPERAAEIFKQGKAGYRQAKVAQKLETMGKLGQIDAQQFAQSGEANALKKYARQTLRDYYKGKATGLNPREVKTLEEFNKGALSEWALKKARQYFKGPIGAILGSQIGSVIPGIGHAVGAAVGVGLGEGAGKLADRLAVQRWTKFIDSVREDGNQRLQSLLGDAVHGQITSTPRGKAAVNNWVNKIGTTGLKAAARSLALVVAQEVRQPRLAPKIETELNQLADQIQGTAESQAEPDQQQ